MTKEEAIQSLQNTKVYVAGKSKEIQEKLFELGFTWTDKPTKVIHTNKPFLYIERDSLSYGNGMKLFSRHLNKEITADYIIGLTWNEGCQFKPFDRVLVRNSDEQQWHVAFYSHQDDGGFVINVGWHREQCIPYEGNEDLVGTINKPK